MGPPFPPGGLYLLNWFLEISPGRAQSGFGPLPLSSLEIWAWCQLRGVSLTQWEVGILRDLDHLWIGVMTKR